jgi:DNA-binding NarL/FixJ family response regulator
LRGAYPALPVVVVSASDRASDVIRAIDLGAMGFVPKRASNDILFQALRQVMSGGIYVPPMTLGADAGAASRSAEAPPAVARRVGSEAAAADYQTQPPLASLGLTPRQTDVLALLLQGKPNKLIAREMGLSVETVKDHVAAVLRALGVSSRTQAVLAVSQITREQGAFPTWRRTKP